MKKGLVKGVSMHAMRVYIGDFAEIEFKKRRVDYLENTLHTT